MHYMKHRRKDISKLIKVWQGINGFSNKVYPGLLQKGQGANNSAVLFFLLYCLKESQITYVVFFVDFFCIWLAFNSGLFPNPIQKGLYKDGTYVEHTMFYNTYYVL